MSFENGLGDVFRACFTGDGEAVLTAGSLGLIRWSIPEGRARVVDEHACYFVAAERGTTRAASLDDDGVLRVFDIELDPPLLLQTALDLDQDTLLQSDGECPMTFCHGDNALLVFDDYGLQTVDLEDGAVHKTRLPFPRGADANAGHVIAVGAGEVTLISRATGERTRLAEGADAVAVHPGGKWVAWTEMGHLTIQSLSGAVHDRLDWAPQGRASALAFDDDDALLIGSANMEIMRWQDQRGVVKLAVDSARAGGFTIPRLSPRGDRVALEDEYFGRVDVHDAGGALLVSLGRFGDGSEDTGCERVWASPDGERVLFQAGIGDGQNSNDDLFLWDNAEQRVRCVFYRAEQYPPFVIGEEIFALLGGDKVCELIAWDHEGNELARVPLPAIDGPTDDLGVQGRLVFIPSGEEEPGGYIVDVDKRSYRHVDQRPDWADQGTGLF